MLTEYRCVCGFKTVFVHKIIRHKKECNVYKQREMEGYASSGMNHLG
jgi:hypothetical protein